MNHLLSLLKYKTSKKQLYLEGCVFCLEGNVTLHFNFIFLLIYSFH